MQVYKRVKDSVTTEKEAVICQRENPFYVNTVKAFRDRRYDYKGLTKVLLHGMCPLSPVRSRALCVLTLCDQFASYFCPLALVCLPDVGWQASGSGEVRQQAGGRNRASPRRAL